MGEVVERAERWIAALAESTPRAATLLEVSRADPESLDFTRRLIESVAGTDDAFSSALGLREMAQDLPDSMPASDRLAVRAGGAVSLGMPWAVMPVARKWLRDRVADLVLATKLPSGSGRGRLPRLTEALRRHSETGMVPVLMPLGHAVHGREGARGEAMRLAGLAAHPAVRHLVVDPERLAPGGNDWTIDVDLEAAVRGLRPVLEAARDQETAILLVPSSVRWARVVPDLLKRAFSDASFDSIRAGVGIVAELPESVEMVDSIARWAQMRVADGGAVSEIVIGTGAGSGRQLAAKERIASISSGLPVPVIEGRVEQLAQLFRLAERALRPGQASSLRPVFATEEPRTIAQLLDIADRLGSSALCSVQLRSGVAPGLAEMIAGEASEVRVQLPVVSPGEFSGALDLLLGAAAEASDPAREELWEPGSEHERSVLQDAVALAEDPPPASHRRQARDREWDPSERDSALFYRPPDEPGTFDTGGLTAAVLGLTRGSTGELRLTEIQPERTIPAVSRSGFANEPETDATLPQNRAWARGLLHTAAIRAEEMDEENPTIALGRLGEVPASDPAPERALEWSSQPPHVRASKLRRMALATAAARDRLIIALAVDTGAPVGALDREVSNIIDAARYGGQLAEGLRNVRGAVFVAAGSALVAASEGVSLAEQVSEVLSALAAGSEVRWAVSGRVAHSAAVLLEEWQIAGLPERSVRLDPSPATEALGNAVLGADRAVVLGEREVARNLMRHRPDLPIEGRFVAPGATVVMPSADIDQAISDIVASAFSGAASLRATGVILVGAVARSRRLRDGLADAVRSLRVGDAARPGDQHPLSFHVGPLQHAPSEAGLRALTELERGEDWLLAPEQIDEDGLLWRPGVRIGVAPESPFWSDALGMPVIGITHAHSLREAAGMQGGAVAALQTGDASDADLWLDRVAAASLAINRPTTHARVERQPWGGWDEAAMGMPTLTGGPNRLITLGSWQARSGTRSETLHLRGLEPEVQLLIQEAQRTLSYEQFDEVRRAALADMLSWRTMFGSVRDEVSLGVERNVLRHWPVATQVRLAEGGSVAEFVRVLAAALITRAQVTVSTGEVLPSGVNGVMTKLGIEVSLERDEDWLERLSVSEPSGADGTEVSRVRLIGGDGARAAEWLGGLDRVALWAEPVTMAGPVELLVMLREQSVSVRAHRHGLAMPAPGLDELLG